MLQIIIMFHLHHIIINNVAILVSNDDLKVIYRGSEKNVDRFVVVFDGRNNDRTLVAYGIIIITYGGHPDAIALTKGNYARMHK